MKTLMVLLTIITFAIQSTYSLEMPTRAFAKSLAKVGDIIHKITVPVSGSTNHCSIGLAFNGTDLFYNRCADDNIYRISPQTGELKGTFDTNIPEFPNAMSYDASRNSIWMGAQRCNQNGMPIYLWNLTSPNEAPTLRFTIPTTLLNPATNEPFLRLCFVDGIAFDANEPEDPNDDEIWFSDDVNYNLAVFSTNGILLRGYDTRTVDSSLVRTSGIAVGGKYLYLGNNGGGDVFRSDKSANPLLLADQFVSSDSRQEDMECDPITFAPTEVMWVRTTPQGGQFPDVITAYEIEPNSCNLGGAPTDQDGDGLYDSWERFGIDDNGDGTPEVNLPAMGASPDHPDIFVEVDWMEQSGQDAHTHRPSEAVIRKIVQAFAEAPGGGIRLHVDVGPESKDFWTGKLWGNFARGNKIDHELVIGNSVEEDTFWNKWQALVTQNFQQDNRAFRHALFIHRWQVPGFDCVSGIAHPIEQQVFIISLGGWPAEDCTQSPTGIGTDNEQAGTFMHELGHTLGLQHGGDKGEVRFNHKPNYLSVMNYSFQTGGLLFQDHDGHFDYSRVALPELREETLSESIGLGTDRQLPFGYGTKYKASVPFLCLLPGGEKFPNTGAIKFAVVKDASAAIDWDCDFGIDNNLVKQDLNGDGTDNQVLSGYDDWANLKFMAGHVGALGARSSITVASGSIVSASHELTASASLAIPQMSEPRVHLLFAGSPHTTTYKGILNYSIILTNTDLSEAQGIVLSITLPIDFAYKSGSTTGLTTTEPTVADSILAWRSLSLDSGLTATLNFQAIASASDGVFPSQISGKSANGAIISINDVVTVTVKGMRIYLPIVLHNASGIIDVTATPINTPTPTHTSTNTPRPTPTNTLTRTPTPSASPTNTPTASPTNTPNPSPTSTSTPSPTITSSPTPTPSPTRTPQQFIVAFQADSSDAEIGNINCVNWLDCHGALTGNFAPAADSPLGSVSADLDQGSYAIKRVFLSFDTTTLPSDAKITNVLLYFRTGSFLVGNTSLHVVSSSALPPYSTESFGKVGYVSGGSYVIRPDDGAFIAFNEYGRSLISKGGVTRIALLNDFDLRNDSPFDRNGVLMYMTDADMQDPQISVFYEVP